MKILIKVVLVFALAVGVAHAYMPLIEAIESDNYDEAIRLIEGGADVNAKNGSGIAPLHTAAWENLVDIASILISEGADVDIKDNDGLTPLHWAAWNNSVDVADLLISKGADVKAIDRNHDTPLQKAVAGNHTEVANLLLSKGAGIDDRNHSDAPLHDAVRSNSVDAIELLISQGANVNTGDHARRTPLHYAAQRNLAAVAELLISKGADVNAESADGKTPFDYATDFDSDKVIALLQPYENARQRELAAERESELVAQEATYGGETLIDALKSGNQAKAIRLIEGGADVNAKNFSGSMPLHEAAWNNLADAAKLLIAKGADVNAQDNDGFTALHWAERQNSVDVAKLLLTNGADVSIRGNRSFNTSNSHEVNALTEPYYAELLAKSKRELAEKTAQYARNEAERERKREIAAQERAQRRAEREAEREVNSASSGFDWVGATNEIIGVLNTGSQFISQIKTNQKLDSIQRSIDNQNAALAQQQAQQHAQQQAAQQPQETYSAIAVGTVDGRSAFGASIGSATRSKADQKAMQSCTEELGVGRCSIYVRFTGSGCAAVAATPAANAYGFGWAHNTPKLPNTKNATESDALSRCRQSGGVNCRVGASACTDN